MVGEKPKWYPPWGAEGPYFEDFEVGMKIKSWPGRTFTITDNLMWLAYTGDCTPLYIDEEYAKHTEYGRVIIHPIIVLSSIVAMSVKDTSQNSVAFLGAEYQRIYRPLYPGDTLYVEAEVVLKRESKSRPEAGIITWIHRGYNQRGELVAEVKRTNLMYRRGYSPWREYLKRVGKI
jgi:acyl dehydratase